MGLVLGLITYIGWGAGDIFAVIATRKIGAYKTTALVFIAGFTVATLFIPFALDDLHKITFNLLVLNFLFGTACLLGNFFINEAFKRSNVSLVGIIIQSFPALTLILSAVIFKDSLTARQLLWTAIIFSGVILCMINFNDLKKSEVFTDSGIKLAVLTACIFTIYFTFFRIFLDAYGWFWSNYISFMSFPLTLIIAKRLFTIKESIEIPKAKKVLIAAVMSGIFLRGADIALNYALAHNLASIAAPISGASPTLFIALSSLIFRDPISRQQKLGIGISLLGIILLSFFSS